MIPAIGEVALFAALVLAAVQVTGAIAAVGQRCPVLMGCVKPAAIVQLSLIILAFACLAWSFARHDFSILYVTNHSNLQLPLGYRLAAVWAGHEGSLLLWLLLLNVWSVATVYWSRTLPENITRGMQGVLGLVSIGLLLLILLISNPFEPIIPVPLDGKDLNPILQDVAMVLHPPMLYAGYAGLSIPFAFVVAMLLVGRFESQWIGWLRPWVNGVWALLTLGIALGSWWGYYEIGWGGWWSWDPVDNISFMPWLMTTALIHALVATEQRGLFKSWSVLLAISAFSLGLVGTFVSRTGILMSQHSFANDPGKSIVILGYFGVLILGALVLYGWRVRAFDRAAGCAPGSRAFFLLINNLLLTSATLLIFIGTFYPVFAGLFKLGTVSIDRSYYETAFLIPMLPLVLCMGVGMHTVWQSANTIKVLRRLRVLIAFSLLSGAIVPALVFGVNSLLTATGVSAGLFVVLAACRDPVLRLISRNKTITRSMLGMPLAHLGLGLFVLGVTVTSAHSTFADLKIRIHETVEVGDDTLRFAKMRLIEGPNYTALQADMVLEHNGQTIAVLQPEKRRYNNQSIAMSEVGIDAGWTRDIFVALGDDLGGGEWSIRVQYKPMIRFIWLGAMIMALGGLMAASDPRDRKRTG